MSTKWDLLARYHAEYRAAGRREKGLILDSEPGDRLESKIRDRPAMFAFATPPEGEASKEADLRPERGGGSS